jgi:F-type H+-transporting ATPase subunit b
LLLVFGSVAVVEAAPEAESGAASHDDHHAAPGHAGANTSPDEVKGDLAIFSAIVFLLLVVILRKFAWGPIAAGLEKREGHIAHEIAAAEKANHDAKAMLAEYQTRLDAAQGEVKAMLDEARRDAEHTKQEFVAEARKEAMAEAARAKREIETAKDQAMRELAQVATDQALALAGKLLQQKLQPADHARLIDEALANFPKSKANLN